MKEKAFTLNEETAKGIFLACSTTNIIDAFLEEKFGKEYTEFRVKTATKWIEAARMEREARASVAQTTNKNPQKQMNNEATK